MALWNQSPDMETNGLGKISLQWTQKFAHIDYWRNEKILPSAMPDSIIDSILSKKTNDVVRSWKRIVTGLPLEKRHLLWQEVMLWALQHRIDKALTFLEATVSEPSIDPPRHAVDDALKFVVSAYLEHEVADSELKTRLHCLFYGFAKASMLQAGYTYWISSKTIYLLLRHSEDVQVQTLYEVISHCRLHLHPYSLTHFMDRFSRMGRPDLAVDVLWRIAECGANMSHETVQYSCVTLLRSRFDEDERYKIQSSIVTAMLKLGIRPGIPMLNTMMLNAIEARDYQTAQAIFETARIHGKRPSTITYAIMLRVALQNLDEKHVGQIMHTAEEDGALPRNNELVFSLILTMLQIAEGRYDARVANPADRHRRYRAILGIYARYCNSLPLQELGIYSSVHEHHVTASAVSEPTPKILSIMLVSYIRFLGEPDHVYDLYCRYQSHVECNNPLIAATAEIDRVANAFLMGLGRSPSAIKWFSVVLRNMLEPSATTAVTVARPNVQTWSIVARFYFLHGQRAAAEKVIDTMRKMRVEPSPVTWNIIIHGYAYLQDAASVVAALEGMESAGCKADSSTFRGLTKFNDRNRLLDALRAAAAQDQATLTRGQAEQDSVQLITGSETEDDGLQYQPTTVTP
ncbi:MAG: hypothetical protein Q9223_004681 [Gallowayella weberi]